MKRIFVLIIFTALLICSMINNVFFKINRVDSISKLNCCLDNSVSGKSSSNTINYVSLGDSIAVGYLLDGHNEGEEPSYNSSNNTYSEGKFIPNSYSYWFKSRLVSEFGANNVNAVTYARSGDKIGDLLNKLNSVNVSNAVASADVVTICIGANDILGPATENIWGFIQANPTCTIQQMDAYLDAGLNALQDNSGQVGNLTKLFNRLNALNSNAKFIFTTVYNPYKYLGVNMDDWIDDIIIPLIVNPDNIHVIGRETEIYLAGGVNSSGRAVKGLNQILTEGINRMIASGHTNYAIVDTKAEFDKVSRSQYSEYVNCWLTTDYDLLDMLGKYNLNIDWASLAMNVLWGKNPINDYIDQIVPIIMKSIDPHPKPNGHAVLCIYFETAISLVKFNSQGGSEVKDQIVITNRQITQPDAPYLNSQIFGGWFIDSACQNVWNFSNVLTNKKTVLYAKWTNLTCKNETLLTQYQDSIQPIDFYIDVQDLTQWFVNDKLQLQGATTFSYTPTEYGRYNVYCMVNGVKSYQYTGQVFYVPNNLLIKHQSIGKNTYKLQIDDANIGNMDQSKCVWYKKSTNEEANQIGIGATVNITVDDIYDIYVVYQTPNNIKSNTINVIVEYNIGFETQGGNTIQDLVAKKSSKIPKPTNPHKETYIFDGWYKEQDCINLWDFDKDIVMKDTILYAKWSGLVCKNESALNQLVNRTQIVNFSIDTNKEVEWYINGTKQNSTLANFSFNPDGYQSSYDIYCKVGNIKTTVFTINVNYYKPEKIKIISKALDKYTYKVSIADEYVESIDASKIIWYDNEQVVGEGVTTLVVTVDKNSNIYATYEGENVLNSNQLELKPNLKLVNLPRIFAVCGIIVGSIVLLILCKILIKKAKKRRREYIFDKIPKWK